MPLQRSRRIPEKPLPEGSRKDGLYDQLLASLTQGGEPITTEKEYWQWVRENRNRGTSTFDEAAPWPIRRREALENLWVLDKTWLPMQEMEHELRKIDAEKSETDEPIEPLDLKQIRADYHQWRNNIIRKYRLEGLLPELDK